MTKLLKGSFIKFVFKASLLACLVSCSQIPSQIMPQWTSSIEAIKGGLFGYSDYEITPEIVENIPYASMRVKIGKGPAGLMILQSFKGNILTWVSADNISINIYKGRIIGTSKLSNNLVDYFPKNEISFSEILSSNSINTRKYRSISLNNPPVSSMEILVNTSIKGRERINILGTEREVILIEEEVSNKYIKWNFTNKFWVDVTNGFVWKSIQQIAPNVPPIVLEVTKKPA